MKFETLRIAFKSTHSSQSRSRCPNQQSNNQENGGITFTTFGCCPLPTWPRILLPCLHPHIKVVTLFLFSFPIAELGCLLFWILACFYCLEQLSMIQIIIIMISELQSLGVCLLEPCLLPCWRLASTPSKVSNVLFFITMPPCGPIGVKQ